MSWKKVSPAALARISHLRHTIQRHREPSIGRSWLICFDENNCRGVFLLFGTESELCLLRRIRLQLVKQPDSQRGQPPATNIPSGGKKFVHCWFDS
ncbi:hypothetical protein [Sulfuriferula plumbiphila]|uniref:hypothetical protein n=1 Tax=Sulfuriferula plumbiphila TaxID=171865 RepID=UPI0011BE53D0|nr:hypothetical protein [Sulfuriferula plumbiphila]